MSSKTVKFGRDPTTERSSRGHGHRHVHHGHHHSRHKSDDLGMDTSHLSFADLQELLAKAAKTRDEWKNKALDLGAHLSQKTKDLQEIEARWRGLNTRWEILEQDKVTITEKMKKAQEENAALRHQVRTLQEQLDRAQPKINRLGGSRSPTPPHMSGANPDAPRRRSSIGVPQTTRQNEKEADKQVRDMESKLRDRFARTVGGEECDRGSGVGASMASSRRRRGSYIEPMGPKTTRPVPAAPVPPSPSSTRQFPMYGGTTPQYAPQFPAMQPSVVGQVPRSVGPPVYEGYGNFVNGNYQPFPLLHVPTLSGRDRR